ncbi:MAG: hypothetical protein ACQESN_03560 [Thermotogota bacterium]
MIYIFVSTKFEKNLLNLKLKKLKNKYHDIYINEKFTLIITGIGAYNVSSLVAYISALFPIRKNDIILNFGISATKTKSNLNKTFRINKVYDSLNHKDKILDMTYNLDLEEASLKTVHKPINNNEMIKDLIYDMEGSAFYHISRKYFERQNIFIIKTISDTGLENFNIENVKINHYQIKNTLEKLYNISKSQKKLYKLDELERIKEKIYNSTFTKYQQDKLSKLIYKLILDKNFEEKNLDIFLSKNFKNKNERNYYFEKFINEII